MESHNKMIQLILPNHKIIKINLSGDEKELKDLISEIAGVSPSQIKGIKDSNHNYYTISSALKNDDVLKQKDVISKVKFPKYVIAVTGSSGKGTTCNLLKNTFSKALFKIPGSV